MKMPIVIQALSLKKDTVIPQNGIKSALGNRTNFDAWRNLIFHLTILTKYLFLKQGQRSTWTPMREAYRFDRVLLKGYRKLS
jgi:hypothetical protein